MCVAVCLLLSIVIHSTYYDGQPTGENGATRAPIIIDLSREESLSSKAIILQIDNKSQQVSASKAPYLHFLI